MSMSGVQERGPGWISPSGSCQSVNAMKALSLTESSSGAVEIGRASGMELSIPPAWR